MKIHSTLLLAAALLAGGCQSTPANPNPAAPADITVDFKDPENFTDVRDSFGGGTSQYYLGLLAQHIRDTAAARLTAGQKLAVTFTDIDLAGDIPPGQTDNVRLILAAHIPRMTLSFQLTDASGAVLRSGERRLSELDYQMKIIPTLDRNEPLNYDKQMLTDWVHKEFGQ
jgi:hypothetical protein